jgi:glycosyltransferase involved in cell wall biosynthesis
MKKKIAIIGSHGLHANYGGWDQLVINLVENKKRKYDYLVFNSKDSNKDFDIPSGTQVIFMPLKASGLQGILYDYISILISFFKADVFLLLGGQGMPIIFLLNFIFNKKIIVNSGGVEWEREKFGYLAKRYLKLCFDLCFKSANHVIIDNNIYKKYISPKSIVPYSVIPYGGTIDNSLIISKKMIKKYSFLEKDFFLSVSRSIEDNQLNEICDTFIKSKKHLVLISNLSNSQYGKKVLHKYSKVTNITLIDGLYAKPELDLIRKKCICYIHTHSTCGTAPSLVEMIMCKKPIISFDVPQNRNTLNNSGVYFSNFDDLANILKSTNNFSKYLISKDILKNYKWPNIIETYENLF